MTTKKVPQRMCIVCRTMHPKNELTRIVRLETGEIIVDKTGKAPVQLDIETTLLASSKDQENPSFDAEDISTFTHVTDNFATAICIMQ